MTTNATNETQYFHFPLFVSGDKPSWLTDWNGTVEELDNILEEHRLAIRANAQGMESFNEQITVIHDRLTVVNERLSNDEATIEDIQTALAGFNTAIIQADTSIKELLAWKTDKETELTQIHTQLTSVTNTLTDLSNAITQNTNAISQIQQNITSLSSTVQNVSGKAPVNQYNIHSLYEAICGATAWSSTGNFNMGDVVALETDSGILNQSGLKKYDFYYCKKQNTGEPVSNTEYWDELNLSTKIRSAISEIVLDIFMNGRSIAPAWDKNSHAYKKGDIVILWAENGNVVFSNVLGRPLYSAYICLQDHTSSDDLKPGTTSAYSYWRTTTLAKAITDVSGNFQQIETEIENLELSLSDKADSSTVSDIQSELLDIANATGNSSIVTTVNDTEDALRELKNMQGQSTLENAARQAINTDMDRYRFLLSMESNNWDSSYKRCDVLSGSYWNTATENIASFLKGNTTQSVSKLISISMSLSVNHTGHNGDIIRLRSGVAVSNYNNDFNARFNLACYETGVNTPSANYDRLYSLPIKSVSVAEGMEQGSEKIFVSYDVEAPAFLYNDISQFARIFLTFNTFDYINVYYADNSAQIIDVDIANISKIALKKVGI